jgi:hypothetical protein
VKLELVEQTMKELAERDADVAVLAKLDRFRAQIRQALARRGSSRGHG